MPDRISSPSEYSDEMLVARLVQQDVVAFTLLYDRYGQTVYTLAVHLLGSADAEDGVQEIFLRLWRKAHLFDESRGSFKSWFMTLARNHIKDELRRRHQDVQHRALTNIDDLFNSVADPTMDVAQTVWDLERQTTILQGLQRLPPEQRRPIVLAYFGGLSQSSIASHLGWPLGTVKKRIRLGLQKLRALYVREDEARS